MLLETGIKNFRHAVTLVSSFSYVCIYHSYINLNSTNVKIMCSFTLCLFLSRIKENPREYVDPRSSARIQNFSLYPFSSFSFFPFSRMKTGNLGGRCKTCRMHQIHRDSMKRGKMGLKGLPACVCGLPSLR